MCFCFTKTLWPGYPPDLRHPRAMSMGTEMSRLGTCPKRVPSPGTGSPVKSWSRAAAGHQSAVQPSRATPPPASVPRSSTARMSSSSAGKPETGGTPTPPGVEFVRYTRSCGLGFRQTGPQTAQNGRESGFPGFGGATPPWISRHPWAKGTTQGGSSSPRWSRPSSRLMVSRITSAGSSATTRLRSPVAHAMGFGGWSTSTPSAPVAGRKRRGQRGRSPPPAPPGTHGVWPRWVGWLSDKTWLSQPPQTPLNRRSGHRPEQPRPRHRGQSSMASWSSASRTTRDGPIRRGDGGLTEREGFQRWALALPGLAAWSASARVSILSCHPASVLCPPLRHIRRTGTSSVSS